MHRQQVARIAADDQVSAAGCRKSEILVVLGIGAFCHRLDRLDTLGSDEDDIENALTALKRHKSVELWPEQYVPIFLLDSLGKDEPVGTRDGAKQRPLW